jgi:competence protein ComEA
MQKTVRQAVAFLLLAVALAPLAAQAAPTGVVNVNTATAQQLQLLPRVGPSLAARILDQRKSNGGRFTSLEDLMMVKGIGEKSFAQLKPYVALSGETTLKEKVKSPRSTSSTASKAKTGAARPAKQGCPSGGGAGSLPPRPPSPLHGGTTLQRANGYQLVELVVALAMLAMTALLVVPPVLSMSAAVRVDLAAHELAAALYEARALARTRSTYVGLKLRTQGGHVTFACYADGNNNGVRTAEIDRGVDRRLTPVRLFAYFGPHVSLGFPPGRAPRDPDEPRRRLDRLDDPIRFNGSDIASFGPLGTSTPGSFYVTDGRRQLVAVRVLGMTGRVRILRWDPDADAWRP